MFIVFCFHTFFTSSDFFFSDISISGQEEKDYFQKTDELTKENAHFALSEALCTVIEEVTHSHILSHDKHTTVSNIQHSQVCTLHI